MAHAELKTWSMVSNTRRLQALDISVMIASSFFWAWFMLSALFPVTYSASESLIEIGTWYRFIALATGTAVFLFAAFAPQRATGMLDSHKWEIGLVVGASIGNVISLLACLAMAPMLACLAGIVEGSTFPYFMLEWSRMYARHGARTAMPLISGALLIALAEIGIILSVPSLMQAVLIIALPLIILFSLTVIHRLTESKDGIETSAARVIGAASSVLVQMSFDDEEEAHTHAGSAKQFTRSFLLLVVSFVFFGFYFASFGLSTWNIGESSLFFSAGAFTAALVAFVLSILTPRLVSVYEKGILLIGLAGLLFQELIGPLAGESALLSCSSGICFTGTLIAAWAICAHLAYKAKAECSTFSATVLSALSIGVIAFLALQIAGAIATEVADNSLWISAEAFCLVVAMMFLFSNGSYLWRNLANLLETEEREYDTAHSPAAGQWDRAIQTIVKTYHLTDRERDVLRYSLMGHSRARIADAMGLSTNTVSSHVQHIYAKMNIHSHQELLDYALDASRPPAQGQ